MRHWTPEEWVKALTVYAPLVLIIGVIVAGMAATWLLLGYVLLTKIF